FRFRIVRRGCAWQRRVTVGAFVGYEMRRVRHTFGRQQLLQMGWMIGLSAAFALGLFLADRLSSAKRISGRWRRRVAGVRLQTCFQLGQPPFQLGEASVPLAASRAARSIHAAML